ncbi:ester cyclase [Mycobacterium sp.]|uniref:ester cyclase n=1 Tax=Mycobacterium sp. TaxID=1785 RepID=UPI003F94A68D
MAARRVRRSAFRTGGVFGGNHSLRRRGDGRGHHDRQARRTLNGIEPTGKRIRHEQVHIFRVADGQITHHRAVRDDLGLLLQLGWRPGGRS